MAPMPATNNSMDDLWNSQFRAGYFSLNAGVVLGIILWDYILLLPEERSLHEKQKKREWQSPAPWAFIALRYSSLISAVSAIVFTSFRLSNCQIAASFSQGTAVIVMASTGIIFCSRVGAFWDYSKGPLAIIFISCIFMVCGWVAVSTQFKATPGPILPFGSNCQFHQLAPWTPISYALTAAFNCITLSLVIIRMLTQGTMVSSNTGFTLINRACLIYLGCATCSSIVVACLYSVNWHDGELIRHVAPLYLNLFMMAMGSRVFLNLLSHNYTIMRVAESNQFTASTWPPPIDPDATSEMTSQAPLRDSDPDFEDPVAATSSTPERIRIHRSVDTFTTTTRTALTIPETDTGTPGTATSSSRSETNTPYVGPPYDRVMTTSNMPRGGSIKSSSSNSTRRTDYYGTPRSPRSVRGGGSIRSYATSQNSESGSTTRTTPALGNPHSSRRVQREIQRESLLRPSTLPPAESLKSTWHGV